MMQYIPKRGFGTYRLKGDIARTSTLLALQEGYDHIDTANLYRNEDEVGKAIKESGKPRNKLWITTKIQVKDMRKGKDAIYNSILNSLNQLGTEYIDLVLFHGPIEDNIIESWKILEEIILGNVDNLKNRVRFIGVSNYEIVHLENLLQNCKVKPYANQFEVSPYLCRENLIKYCQEKGIHVVAHTSLVKGEKFNDTKLTELSEQVKISKPLLLLSWALHKNMIVLPRSSNPDHINENMKCLEIKLDSETIKALDAFHEGYCTHPQYIPKSN
jgi:diketogulonate reductase-like aldo/keto reductase